MDQKEAFTSFTKKVRVRACGILNESNQILLVKHIGIGQEGILWSPPGGGVEFGESCRETVEREFLEETGLIVEVSDFLHFNEHIDSRLHAVELFFSVKSIGGELALGTDPELSSHEQMLMDIRFWLKSEIEQSPKHHFHSRIFDFFN